MAIPADEKNFFEYNAKHRFAAMYPLLAREITDKYGINTGVCLDIGTGSAALAIELSKITDLDLLALDMEPEVIDMAQKNCDLHGVDPKRIRFVLSSVEKIDLPDESAELVISRGSIPFWDDHITAFKEIRRVLTQTGIAMIGCGFSHYQSLEEVKNMRPVWSPEVLEERTNWKKRPFLLNCLQQAEIKNFNIIEDEYGTWVEIRKMEVQ